MDLMEMNTALLRKNRTKILRISYAVVFILLLLGAYFLGRSSAPKIPASGITVENPLQKQKIGKTFQFSVKDQNGKELTEIKYFLDTAEYQHEIIIKGQTAVAVKGKVFLILNLKLTNDYNKDIQINSRDYVRLTVNNASDLLAPELHNDPIQVDAISTKLTRLGFAINETDKNLVLHGGEIDGKKTDIPLKSLGQ